MPPPDHRPRASAHRPLLTPGRGKRALTNIGGAVETAGDPELARIAATAFAVRAGERDATLTHPFHAYPARLHPEVARQLLATLAPVERAAPITVLDPCCGSGTVAIETLAAGHRALGTDLSPLAVELARLKTRRTSSRERRSMVETAHRISRDAAVMVRQEARPVAPPGEAAWFDPRMLAEVAALAACIRRIPPGFERDAARMLFSSIVVKVSRQTSDSDTRVVDKPLRPGAALHFFARKSLELDRCLAALAHALPRDLPPADIHLDDATALSTVADAAVDLVITSPPYANTYNYLDQHARRYAWLQLDSSTLAEREVGAVRWFAQPALGVARFTRELQSICAALHRVMKPGALACAVIADGAAAGRALRADDALSTAANHAGLRVAARVSQARPVFDATSARAFGRDPKREHLVVLERPASRGISPPEPALFSGETASHRKRNERA